MLVVMRNARQVDIEADHFLWEHLIEMRSAVEDRTGSHAHPTLCILLPNGARRPGERGSITATVADLSGSVVRDVTVTITRRDEEWIPTMKSKRAGEFRSVGLGAGYYNVCAEAPGFAMIERAVILREGDRVRIDFRMFRWVNPERLKRVELSR